MTAHITKELFIDNLTVYMLNTVSNIKRANKETQKRWISEIQNYVLPEYLDPSFNRYYADKTKAKGVVLSIVWDDIRKIDKWKAILILSEIDEVSCYCKADFQEKALIYIMNAYVRGDSIEFKVFPN